MISGSISYLVRLKYKKNPKILTRCKKWFTASHPHHPRKFMVLYPPYLLLVTTHRHHRDIKTVDVLHCARLITIRLIEQGYFATRLESSLQKFYRRHRQLLDRYAVSIYTKRNQFVQRNIVFRFILPRTWLFYEHLGYCFCKSIVRLLYRCTWSMLPNCSFTFVALNVLFRFFMLLVMWCLLPIIGFCPLIAFLWFLYIVPWFPWFLSSCSYSTIPLYFPVLNII